MLCASADVVYFVAQYPGLGASDINPVNFQAWFALLDVNNNIIGNLVGTTKTITITVRDTPSTMRFFANVG